MYAALSAGAVSFGQIVKAAEPAFAALLGVCLVLAGVPWKMSPSPSPSPSLEQDQQEKHNHCNLCSDVAGSVATCIGAWVGVWQRIRGGRPLTDGDVSRCHHLQEDCVQGQVAVPYPCHWR